MLFIRCDSSIDIGSGHVIRCLNLAEQCKKMGCNPHFFCRPLPGNMILHIQKQGFDVSLIDAKDEMSDVRIVKSLVHQISPNKVSNKIVVDHYELGIVWHREIREVCNLIVAIDDLANKSMDCDLIINQNIYSPSEDVYKNCVTSNSQLRVGPKYALLAEKYFVNKPQLPRLFNKIERIVVFFGGSDQPDLTLRTVLALESLNDIRQIDVVLGRNYKNKKHILEISSRNEHIRVHDNIDDFASFCIGADLMIGAGGITQLERCCLGIPGIVIATADNQIIPAQNMAKSNGSIYLGWHDEVDKYKIINAIHEMQKNLQKRHEIAKAAFELVDGLGALRISGEILNEEIMFKSIKMSDAELIFEWRNDPDVRIFSNNTNEIDLNSHLKWLTEALKNPDIILLMAIKEDQPIGVVRFDCNNDVSTISIYLSPIRIGSGLGKSILAASHKWLESQKKQIKTIHAYIKDDNIRSKKTFLSVGYKNKEAYFEYTTKN